MGKKDGDTITGAMLQPKLHACLTKADGGARFAGVLEKEAPLGARLDLTGAQSMLGMSTLVLARFQEKRGAADAHRVIDAVLARWDGMPAKVEGHIEDFLQNAFAVVGAKHELVVRLVGKLPAKPKNLATLANLTALYASAKDESKLLATAKRALDAGVLPAQLERDRELRVAVAKPKLRALLDRYRVKAPKKRATAKGGAKLEAAIEKLSAVYADQLAKLPADAPERHRQVLAVVLPAPAKAASIAAVEKARKVTLPDDYKAFLARHDGACFGVDDLVVLATADLHGDTPLARKAKSFISDSADYGSPELLECVPVANIGGPNNWLLFDPRATKYLYCLNADHFTIAGLTAAIERVAKIQREIAD